MHQLGRNACLRPPPRAFGVLPIVGKTPKARLVIKKFNNVGYWTWFRQNQAKHCSSSDAPRSTQIELIAERRYYYNFGASALIPPFGPPRCMQRASASLKFVASPKPVWLCIHARPSFAGLAWMPSHPATQLQNIYMYIYIYIFATLRGSKETFFFIL